MGKIIKKGVEYASKIPEFAVVYVTLADYCLNDNAYFLRYVYDAQSKYVLYGKYENSEYHYYLYEVKYSNVVTREVYVELIQEITQDNRLPIIVTHFIILEKNYFDSHILSYFTSNYDDFYSYNENGYIGYIAPMWLSLDHRSNFSTSNILFVGHTNPATVELHDNPHLNIPGQIDNDLYGCVLPNNSKGQYASGNENKYFYEKRINFNGNFRSNNTNVFDNILSPLRYSVERGIPDQGITIDLDRDIRDVIHEFSIDFSIMDLVTILLEYTDEYKNNPTHLNDVDVYNSYLDRVMNLVLPSNIRHIFEIRSLPIFETSTTENTYTHLYISLKNNLLCTTIKYEATYQGTSYTATIDKNILALDIYFENKMIATNSYKLTTNLRSCSFSAYGEQTKNAEYSGFVTDQFASNNITDRIINWDGLDPTTATTDGSGHILSNVKGLELIVLKPYLYYGNSSFSDQQLRFDLGEPNPLFSANIRSLEGNTTGEVVGIDDQAITGISMAEPFRTGEQTGCLHPISNYYTKYGTFYQGSVRFVYHIKNSNNTEFTGKIRFNLRTPKLYPDLVVPAVAATNYPEIETIITYAANRDFKDDPTDPNLVTSKGYSLIAKVDSLPANTTINIAVVLNGTFAILPEE